MQNKRNATAKNIFTSHSLCKTDISCLFFSQPVNAKAKYFFIIVLHFPPAIHHTIWHD